MAPAFREILLGTAQTSRERYVALALIPLSFALSFTAYALGIFEVSGGVVWLPGQAALVGVLLAGWIGFRFDGLVVGWLVTFAALLGYSADHSFLGLSHKSLAERADAFFQLDGFAVLGFEAFVIGTLGVLVGAGIAWAVSIE